MIRLAPIALALLLPDAAFACGGFFCNSQEPVDQAGEDIVFSVDSAAGETTMHVKVEYEGPAEEFSWVVPVWGIPSLGIGTPALFDAVGRVAPTFSRQDSFQGDCFDYAYGGTGTGAGTGTGTGGGGYYSAGGSTTAPSGVTIVDRAQVGPYDTVTLQAQNSADLVTWLSDNGYDMPPGFDAAVAPYVGPDGSFVALKLAKDAPDGDLAPLTLTYPGTTPAVPLQLTAVAAAPDMPLRVTVFGDHRAVPESYLHVVINELAIDWWSWNDSRYTEAVGMAANEAGGHAFATDYAGSPTWMGTLYNDAWTEEHLAAATDAVDFLNRLQANAYPADSDLMDVLQIHIPVPPGVNAEPRDVYNCPACYADELLAQPFDPALAAADVWTLVLEPRKQAADMIEGHAWMTRMVSSVSPEEMTVDPVFTFNPDMGAVAEVRSATDTTWCFGGNDWGSGARALQLTDGREVALPSRNWLASNGMTEYDYLSDLALPAAAIIERTSSSGPPVPVVDNTGDLFEAVREFNEENAGITGWNPDARDTTGGCGCDATGAPAGSLALVGLLGLLARRRRD